MADDYLEGGPSSLPHLLLLAFTGNTSMGVFLRLSLLCIAFWFGGKRPAHLRQCSHHHHHPIGHSLHAVIASNSWPMALRVGVP